MPFWLSESDIIAGDDEVFEAYWSYSSLGCDEQMWDWEGKDSDPYVVRKLFQRFPSFFKERILGVDVFLTYRIPNPFVEEVEKKSVVEVLESIPRFYDVAKAFYGPKCPPPVFEVILPVTSSTRQILAIYNAYRTLIAGRDLIKVDPDLSIVELIGESKPRMINVIPLIEDYKSILKTYEIVLNYLNRTKLRYQRVFIARSDPALNYGLIPAVILSKVALGQLELVEKETGIPIYPIIGAGVPVFRGGLTPCTLDSFLREYAGYYTTTVQSAFKYDFEFDKVVGAIRVLKEGLPKLRGKRDYSWIRERTEDLTKIIEVVSKRYMKIIIGFSNAVNDISNLIPRRRSRRLHIGLFGYPRGVMGVRLPRAIKFCCAMYTMGIPPELVGASALSELSEESFELLEDLYLNMKEDLKRAGGFLSWRNINYFTSCKEVYEGFTRRYGLLEFIKMIEEDIAYLEENIGIRIGANSVQERIHENAVNNFILAYSIGDEEKAIKYLVEAANVRRFLG